MNPGDLVGPMLALGERVRDSVRKALAARVPEDRAAVHGKAASDVIYRIDLDAERAILETLEKEAGSWGGVALVAEGVSEGVENVFPKTIDTSKALWRLIVDPIDGTRGLMVGKRSAFFLEGAAPNRGGATRLSDVIVAVMVEIPTDRSQLSDVFSAIKGGGLQGYTRNLVDGSKTGLKATPSGKRSLRGGFGQISRFFHPGKETLASLEEELVETLYPDQKDNEIAAFEDQYICSGGQLYELLTGKDRFTADLRQSLYARFRREGKRTGHVCHPYDLAAHLVGKEAGVELTDASGALLDAPLDTSSGVDWIGYANASIRSEIEPVLLPLIRKHLS